MFSFHFHSWNKTGLLLEARNNNMAAVRPKGRPRCHRAIVLWY